MLRRLIYGCIVLGALGLAVFLFLTSPTTIAATDIPTAAGDAIKGKYMFYASGCASCHAAPGANVRIRARSGRSSPRP